MTEERTMPEAETPTIEPQEREQQASPSKDEPTHKRGRVGIFVATLLALLALAGAGSTGYLAWQQQRATRQVENGIATLHEQIAQRANAADLAALREELRQQHQDVESALADQVQALSNKIKALNSQIETLRQSLQAQQQALDALRALISRDERLWRLGEIERLLTAAQTRIRLLDDSVTARLLLQEADRTAAPLGGEALPLREALQQTAERMVGFHGLDREGLALRLTQLADAIPNLPLAKPSVEEPETSAQEGWWAQVKTWVTGWMHITRERGAAAIAQEDETLRDAPLRLIEARRAILTRENRKAMAIVDALRDQLASRINTSDERAQVVLADLASINESLSAPAREAIDLSPAFTALRTLRHGANHPGTEGE